jgi:hypothetical protein
MSTAAQIAANQANAKLSTGPRTPEGKAIVAGNAVKHGFCSSQAIVCDEDRGLFEELARQKNSWVRSGSGSLPSE